MNSRTLSLRIAVTLSLVSAPFAALADKTDDWVFGASIYGWFPDISGATNVPIGSGDFTVEIGDIVDNLQFTFQGSLDARKGQWGLFNDLIYMDLGKTNARVKEGTVGGSDLPWEVEGMLRFDMKSWIWTTAGYYRLVDDSEHSFDLLAGARYIDVDQGFDWSVEGSIGEIPISQPEGNVRVGGAYWDYIVGLRGQRALGASGRWSLPYYADIGTGDADLTWQAAAGLAYAFNWGKLTFVWRYLEYDLPGDKAIDDLNFSGPALGLTFNW